MQQAQLRVAKRKLMVLITSIALVGRDVRPRFLWYKSAGIWDISGWSCTHKRMDVEAQNSKINAPAAEK